MPSSVNSNESPFSSSPISVSIRFTLPVSQPSHLIEMDSSFLEPQPLTTPPKRSGTPGEEAYSMPKNVDLGRTWKKRMPSAINFDRRTHARFPPKMNENQANWDNVEEIFYHLLPDKWLEDAVKHTNKGLRGEGINAKMMKGELLAWWGYSLALAL